MTWRSTNITAQRRCTGRRAYSGGAPAPHLERFHKDVWALIYDVARIDSLIFDTSREEKRILYLDAIVNRAADGSKIFSKQ